MTAKERAKLLRPQAVPLWLGLAPLLMFLLYALRSGTGLSPVILGFALFGVVGFAVSMGYHFFCRAAIPKVVIKPMPYWRGVIVVALMLPYTLVNLWGSGAGYSLMLSPNGMENVARWLRVVAKMLLGTPIEANLDQLPRVSAFVMQGTYLGGALWGALGYAVVFAVAGLGFAALRQEAFDPRQEPFGGSSGWPFWRMCIGYYYGMSLGFWFGAAGIWVAHRLFAGSASLAPSIQAMLTALGVVADPNVAFTNAVNTAGWLVAFSTLFLGKADFTVGFSDPRPEEREPDMKIKIPELPKTPEPEFDFASIGHETEQIAQAFQNQLSDLARQLGFLDPVEPASTLAATAQEDHSDEPDQEPAVANVISARRPDFDVSFDSAMGQLSNVYVQVSAQLGSTELPLTEWLTLAEGSILELPRPKDNTISLCINGKPVGKGRAVMLEDHKAIKVLKLSADATQNLG
ncbi:MAG TPA: FliM/FliN family flagellar motor switch protein, partial [Stenomitos sp.]